MAKEKVIVILYVNGDTNAAVRDSKEEAEAEAKIWLAQAEKSYPNKKFIPQYFQARPL